MEGIILGNRYELLEKIGDGGMAQVYKARCRLLNRFVAVKMLKPDFTNDDEFVKRFSNEAQAAASLSHQNIVSIYDVGQEDGMYYIVMEYIDGITLADYIKKNGHLPWTKAVEIAVQVCSAIDEAHKKNIIHRDIKPQNILMTSEGVPKVADFGIARATNTATITLSGSTIGSVHYFSPEQARGGYVDEKSDLYSLGVTLYQMLTGTLPFDGETPVAIALKHLQEQARPPKELDPEIPDAVNAIVIKAMQKTQDARYQSAREMLEDLKTSLTDPNGNFVESIGQSTLTTNRINAISGIHNDNAGDQDMAKSSKSRGKKNADNGDKKIVWIAAIISFVLIATIIIATILIIMPPKTPTKSFTMGDYVGRQYEEVRTELRESDIYTKEIPKYDPTKPKGTIIYQNIAKGKDLKPGYTVEFEVSQGVDLVEIPSTRDLDYREVKATLEGLKLNVTMVDIFSDTVQLNKIAATMPEAGKQVPAGSEIIIYKSRGPELKMIKVPTLTGKTLSAARTELQNAGLKVGTVTEGASDSSIINTQYPLAGTEVRQDTAINLATKSNSAVKKTYTISLTNSELKKYGSTIDVKVTALRSDSTSESVIFDKTVDKSDFPLDIDVDVPSGGNTKLTIELDGKFFDADTIFAR